MDPNSPDAVAVWRKVRDAERRLIPLILEHAHTTWGPAFSSYAWRMFASGDFTPESRAKAWPLFRAWLAFGFIARYEEDGDDPTVSKLLPTVPAAAHWLMYEDAPVEKRDREFVRQALKSPWSLLLVERVMPGASLDVCDLLTGRTFAIVDPEVSMRVLAEQILVAAVLTMQGVSTLLGPAPYAIPGVRRVDADDMRHAHSDDPWMEADYIKHCSVEIFSVYRRACENESDPFEHLDYRVSEHSPLLLRWTLTTPFLDAFDRLRPLTTYDDSDEFELLPGADGEPRGSAVWCSRQDGDDEIDNWRMHGFLYMSEKRLSADVPTEAAADELVALVADALPDARLTERRPSDELTRILEEDALPST